MTELSKDAKIYLRTLLEYAAAFDGFQTALEKTLPDDEDCTRQNKACAEIYEMLED